MDSSLEAAYRKQTFIFVSVVCSSSKCPIAAVNPPEDPLLYSDMLQSLVGWLVKLRRMSAATNSDICVLTYKPSGLLQEITGGLKAAGENKSLALKQAVLCRDACL